MDVIRSVLLKDHDHFRDRRHLDFGHDMFFETTDVLPCERKALLSHCVLFDVTRQFKLNILWATDDKWKPVRTALTPAFTTGRIKMMSEVMQEVADTCIKNLSNKCGKADSVTLSAKP